MTPKERLQRILAQQKTDRPACICPGGMMNMATRDLMARSGSFLPQAHTDSCKMAALAKSAYESGCFENAGVPFCMTVESEAMGAPVALGNEEIEPRVTGYALQSVSEWQNLPTMDLTEGRCAVVLDAIRILFRDCPDLPIVGNLTGPVSVATSLLEPMVFYRELRKNLCPLIKSSYGFYISDKCPYTYFADLIVGEATCDGKKKMYELMGCGKEVYVLHLPQGADLSYAKEMWRTELRRFRDYLQNKFGITITDDALRAAAMKRNLLRKRRTELMELLQAERPPISGTELYTFLDGLGFRFSVDESISAVEELIATVRGQ